MESLKSLVDVPELSKLGIRERATFAFYLGSLMQHNREVTLNNQPQYFAERLELVKTSLGSVDGDNPPVLYIANVRTRKTNLRNPYGLDGLLLDAGMIEMHEGTNLSIMENGQRYFSSRRDEVMYVVDLVEFSKRHPRHFEKR